MKTNKQQRAILTICCLFVTTLLKSQNLVPNSGAEFYTNCPPWLTWISYAPPWTGYQTPDFFHVCSDTVSPFENPVGYQAPYGGDGMLGIAVYCQNVPDCREFLENPLILPLLSGVNYCIKFYVSLADSCSRGIDNVGLLLSDSLLTQYPLQVYTPQIKNPIGSILSDRTVWYEISGIYSAQGGEQFVMLGNFNNDSNTNSQSLSGGGTQPTVADWQVAYYYIDNVSVEEVKSAIAGLDQEIFYGDSVQVGLNQTEVTQYTWSPSTGLSNPTSANPMASPTQTTTYTVTKNQCGVITTDQVTIEVNTALIIPSILTQNETWNIGRLQPNTKVRVYDAGGRLVFNRANYQNDLHASHFSPGVYIYQIFQPTGEKQTGKLVIAR